MNMDPGSKVCFVGKETKRKAIMLWVPTHVGACSGAASMSEQVHRAERLLRGWRAHEQCGESFQLIPV